jgi:hypothetical protein
MEYLDLLIRKSWIPEFLVLTLALGMFLWVASGGLGPPLDKWLRRLGIVLAFFGIASIMMALILGVDLQFQMPGNTRPPWLQEPTNKYNKRTGKELTSTKMDDSLQPDAGKGESQQEGTRKYLSAKDVPKGWYEVNRWEGSGSKQTEVFHIPSYLWMIGWNTVPTSNRPAFFSIKVYSVDGTFIRYAAKAMGEDFDRTFIKSSGDYYLVIDTAQKYTVFVSAQKTKNN